MPIWSRYRYRVEDYWPLIQVLRQSNKYTHGILLPLDPVAAQDPERRKSRGQREAEQSHWLNVHELEELALQKLIGGKPEPTFRFRPNLTAPDLLAHRQGGPKEIKGSRVIVVPEGWVILGRKTSYRGLPELPDFRCSPGLRLTPFIIRWRPEFSDQKLGRAQKTPGRVDQTLASGRLSLQVNRDFVRLKLKIVHQMTSKKHFYERTPGGMVAAWKKEAELIKGVNQVTREMIALKRWAFVEPDTYSAYDSEVRRCVKIWLTSVRHRSSTQAEVLVRKYVLPWRYNPQGLPSKLALQHRAAVAAAAHAPP